MKMKSVKLGLLVGIAVFSGCKDGNTESINEQKVSLGETLYSDTSLSANGTMSCATCHELSDALIDPRVTSMTLGGSLGDDGVSIGDRNAPSAGYTSFSPAFHFDTTESLYIGGQNLDGSAKNLKEQAKGPFLNPIEMGMASISDVIDRVRENEVYVLQFKEIYGEKIFDDVNATYDAVADAIASFEATNTFASFDSKYDRFLDGNYTMTAQELEGMSIYSNEEDMPSAGRCTLCHPIVKEGINYPLMTDFSYDNLGIPINNALRTANGQAGVNDEGLFLNPDVNDRSLKGAFKVSSLRNIAVTGPYMHNGLFKDLKTVVHFYNTRDTGGINPETNSTWETGEFHSSRNTDELGDLGLSDVQEDALVAFLKTFTDAKYEYLVK